MLDNKNHNIADQNDRYTVSVGVTYVFEDVPEVWETLKKLSCSDDVTPAQRPTEFHTVVTVNHNGDDEEMLRKVYAEVDQTGDTLGLDRSLLLCTHMLFGH
jgi:hypothetical protein